jgi:hypothetical protein
MVRPSFSLTCVTARTESGARTREYILARIRPLNLHVPVELGCNCFHILATLDARVCQLLAPQRSETGGYSASRAAPSAEATLKRLPINCGRTASNRTVAAKWDYPVYETIVRQAVATRADSSSCQGMMAATRHLGCFH